MNVVVLQVLGDANSGNTNAVATALANGANSTLKAGCHIDISLAQPAIHIACRTAKTQQNTL